MNISIGTFVPLTAFLGFAVLIILVARQGLQRRVNQLFIWFAITMMLWGFGSFMMHANFQGMDTLFWNNFLFVAVVFGSIAYYHFIQVFLKKRVPLLWLSLGYGICLLFIVATTMGYTVESAYIVDGRYHYEFGIAAYAIAPIGYCYVIASAYQLFQAYRKAKDPLVRNRIVYPLLGALVILPLVATNFVEALGRYPIDQLGNLINAILISYSMLRYKLLDISLVLRRGFVFTVVTAMITAIFLIFIVLLQSMLQEYTGYSLWFAAIVTAILVVIVYQPLLNLTRRWVNRLFHREEYDYRQMLRTSSQAMASMLNLDELGNWLIEKICRAFGTAKAGLFLLDDETHSYRPRILVGYEGPIEGKTAWRRDSPLIRCLDEEERPLRQEEIETFPQLRGLWKSERAELERLGAAMLVPLKAKARLIGMLVLGRKRSGDVYNNDDLELLATLANQASVAIENARLYEEAKHNAERLAVLGEISRIISSSLHIQEVYQAFIQEIKKLVDFDRASIALVEGDRLRFLAVSSVVPTELGDGVSLPLDDTATGWVIQHGRTNIERDLEQERQFPIDEVHLKSGLRSAIRIPLFSKGKVFGTFNLSSRQPHAYGDAEQAILEQIAGHLAVAIENARLYEESLRTLEELRATQDYLIRSERLRALGEMAGGVAHDFNNILAAILGRAQLLLEDITDEKIRKGIQVIEQAALDGAQTVRRLQDFTRVRADRDLDLVDLNKAVEGALEMVEHRRAEQRETGGANIDIYLSLGKVNPIRGNSGELREALINVMLNALDAMPDGGRLTIKTEQQDSWVVCSVKDTGVGIPPEMKHKIFDPFFSTKGAKGTGLGLSVTYGIVTRHGGKIEVESTVGKGTTFQIKFPAAEGVVKEVIPPPPPAPPGKATILVVDDDREVGNVLHLILTQLGHQVTVATRGTEALTMFRQGSYDLVITDLGMPDISGWDIASEIKAKSPETPVILITGWGVQLDATEREKVDGVIAKPFSKSELSAQLAQFLGAKG